MMAAPTRSTMRASGSAPRARSCRTSWLSTLRVRPLLGRGFTADEAEPGRDAVVILTHAYWRRRFGSNPDVLGINVAIDGRAHTIVGILPPNVFRYGADFVKPLVPASYNADRAYVNLDVFARLRPGITVAQACGRGRHDRLAGCGWPIRRPIGIAASA